MKKKSLLGVLSAICALTAVGATACGGGGHTTHTYTDSVTAPTCTERGYTTHTCECGDTKTDTYVNALGHDFASYISNGDGTETATCSRNGCAVTDTREETPPVTPPEDATEPETPQTYTLTLTKNIDEAGTVTGAGEYEENTSITLTATTNEDYTFLGWYQADTCVSTETTFSFNLTQNTTLQATWELTPPPATYVSVQSIVDDILGDIDVDADVASVVSSIENTKAPTMVYNKTLAIDFDNDSNVLKFYAEAQTASGSTKTIMEFSVPYSQESFYNFVFDKDSMIENLLISKEVTEVSQIEENSNLHNEIVSELNTLKTSYTNEMDALSSTAKANISAKQVFNYSELSADTMTNLGIEDMNEFSYALLNNTRGSGYDKVTGFTEDEVIATYVNALGSPNIDGQCAFTIITVTENGIYETDVYAFVNSSSETYGKILNDSADAAVYQYSVLAEYSENVIVYNNGVRVTE